jgi:beta-lactamase class A
MIGRILGLCAATLFWAGCTSGPEYPEHVNVILGDEVLEEIEQRIGSRLGIALIDDTGTQLRSYRGDERFAMCSTFKLALSAAVLERVEAGSIALDDTIAFGEDDILEYAPVVSERVADGEMTIAELAEAISTVSDNSAANLLLARIGGPEGLTTFFRRHGDDVTRLDRIEPDLNENLPGDPRDTTSPVAMAGLVQRLVLGDGLEPASRAMLAEWTEASTTGLRRIRAGLPEGWRAGDKTGTCWTAYNDIAIIWPSESDPFVLAIYIDRPEATPRQVNAAFAEIGELAASYMTERDIN